MDAAGPTLFQGTFGATGECVLVLLDDASYSFEYGQCEGTYVSPDIVEAARSKVCVPFGADGTSRTLKIETDESLVYTIAFVGESSSGKLVGNWFGPTGEWFGVMYKRSVEM
ncbi:hypothetical protein [Candidatus Rhodobacter oscarellae]|uniref:hypothetical protein n=1 Tax=Candidatus Rhodobacter oscarellae TaxID=1675527 RepID=UPI001F1F74C1|nr:hypothetical protein [Candidatus Rhodobacter lobularis]